VIESLIAEPMESIPAQRKETILWAPCLYQHSNRIALLGYPTGVATLSCWVAAN